MGYLGLFLKISKIFFDQASGVSPKQRVWQWPDRLDWLDWHMREPAYQLRSAAQQGRRQDAKLAQNSRTIRFLLTLNQE